MGLRKKPGAELADVIDIRVATQEFKEEVVHMFPFWTPGMEIHVSHLLKNQLPTFIIPDDYRGPEQEKAMGQQHENKRKMSSEMVYENPSTPGCSSQLKADKMRRLTDEEGSGEENKGSSVTKSDGGINSQEIE